jgi:nucleoside-diphosphate-sugar epimerase
VLFASTTGVYGQTAGERVDESSPTEPTRFTGRAMLEAESIVAARGAGATSLRLGRNYGPGRGRLHDQVRHREAECAAGVFTNRIHRDDAASAFDVVLGCESPPPVLNVVDDDPAERCAVLAWLAARLGAPPPRHVDAAARTRVDNKRVANARLRALGWAPAFPSYRDGYAALL